jgi:antitoxin StbD
METILSDKTVSVTELKKNFASVIHEAKSDAVAILNHNKPEAYLLSASYYERLLDRLEDLEDAELVKQRGNGPFIKVRLDEL